MKVMGIDVGLRCTGYAIIEQGKLITSGVCRTDNKHTLSKRLKKLYTSMKNLMQEESPEIVVYESVFYKQNLKTFSLLAQAKGVLLLAAEELGIEIKEYTPREIKQAVSGSGRASKYQVHKMVERLLRAEIPASLDIGDAIACALCYSSRNEKRQSRNLT